MNFEGFEISYEEQDRELLVLMSDSCGGGVKYPTFWVAQAYFLAYVDVETNELKNGDGRLCWPITNKEEKSRAYFNRFQKGSIYRIKGRKLLEGVEPPGRIPSYYNQFYVTEVLEENASCPALEDILAEYRKPIILQDEVLGELVLNKDLSVLEGYVNWLGKEVSITLDIDKDNKGTWTKARKAMAQLLAVQQEWDREMRDFAAEKLTSLANEWQTEENKNAPKITQKNFCKRIILQSFVMTSGGSFSACYEDDNMFLGHFIVVYGSLKKGLTDADIEG